MICRAMYEDMAAGRPPMPGECDAGSLSGLTDADRLEAALDVCLTDIADARAKSAARARALERASPVPPPMQPLMDALKRVRPLTVTFSCRLSWMRDRLGDRWTKRMVAELFHGQVARRYMAYGGWGDCTMECGAPSARSMTFRFGLRHASRDVPPDGGGDADADMQARGTLALAELGEILGVTRTARRDRESTVGYLEDLRMAAGYMRFDLEAERREGLAMGRAAEGLADDLDANDLDANDLDADDEYDEEYYPPFEGDPDDENFGNG